jgi:hypothetical protein
MSNLAQNGVAYFSSGEIAWKLRQKLFVSVTLYQVF